MSRFKGFVRIAASFDPTDIRLAVMALEGAGFTAITPNLRMTETMPMNSLAFGALEIYVPDRDAANAKGLLTAIADGTMTADAVPEDQGEGPEEPMVKREGLLMNLFAFFLAGVSFPLRGLSVDLRTRRDRDAAG